MSDELAEIRALFFDECDELLGTLDTHLQAFEAGETDSENVNGAFRAIHSIKGGAGAFALQSLIGFAHLYETTLDAVRGRRLELVVDVVTVLRRAADRLADHVDAVKNDTPPPAADTLEDELKTLAGTREEVDLEKMFGGGPAAAATASAPGDEPSAATPPVSRRVTILVRPKRDLFRRALDPAHLFAMLEEHGRLRVTADVSAVPDLAALDPNDCWLAWRLDIDTADSAAKLLGSLEMYLGLDEIEIDGRPASDAIITAAPPAVAAAAPLHGHDATTALPGIARASEPTADAAPLAATAGTERAPPRAEPAARTVPAAAERSGGSIRVDTARIDRLVNLVGEIVVVQALLAEQTPSLDTSKYGQLVDAVGALTRRSRELHEAVMAVRAQPVKTVFQRMPRLIRELAQMLGKEAKLVLQGEHTEVDKTIIEELSEPLTHMLRNSMDHGIETPEVREQAGKPREGTIVLAAEHRGGRILITVSDDGKGIDRDRLLAKAVTNGLVAETARLTPEEIDALIFHPGLSTAAKVSDVSGRGVGMDVVKRSIQAMGGRINVNSDPGRGCRFTLAMPLTLAVLDGMVLRLDTDRYVLPLQSVVETLRADRQRIEWLPNGQGLLRLRDRLAPLLDLRVLLGLGFHSGGEIGPDAIIIVTETDVGQQMAILADEILGQQQVVVKSLEQSYGAIQGVSGASILGDGRVSLILDVDALPMLAGSASPSGPMWASL